MRRGETEEGIMQLCIVIPRGQSLVENEMLLRVAVLTESRFCYAGKINVSSIDAIRIALTNPIPCQTDTATEFETPRNRMKRGGCFPLP